MLLFFISVVHLFFLHLCSPSHQNVSSAPVTVMASPAVWLQIVLLHHVSTLSTSPGNAALNARRVRHKTVVENIKLHYYYTV